MYYDLAIIGAGWAGFNAAVRAQELGLKVALIEKAQIGGTCLNHGCIPTKTLIQSAKVYTLSRKAEQFGIEISNPKINLTAIQVRKDKIIRQLREGMQSMLKGIDLINAEAMVLSGDTLRIDSDNKLNARNILIASGSMPLELKTVRFDGRKIVSSDDMLNLREAPKSILIIGGGVIGCEFASLFSILGSAVTIIEKMPQLLPGEDREIARRLEAIFRKRGIKINTDTDAAGADLDCYDLVLLCIGRAPRIDGLGLEKLDIKIEKGRIIVDEYLRTKSPSIYAAGDCTGKVMLAHFAAYQGSIAAENIAHAAPGLKADILDIPSCIFTEPQIASVGLNEEGARNKNIEAQINRFDFLGSGMARILDETSGIIKIISDKRTKEILGGSIMGPCATELISILTLARSLHLKVSQLRNIILPHPTLSESVTEALRQDHGI